MTRFPSLLLPLLVTAVVTLSHAQTTPHFLSSLASIEPAARRTAAADSFLQANTSFPIVEDSVVTFVYHGKGHAAAVPGEFNEWNPAAGAMQEVPGTELFFRSETLGIGGRVEYKIWVDSAWMLDPLNPRSSEGGVGLNSELLLSGYRPSRLPPADSVAHRGSVDTFWIDSKVLGHRHPVFLYRPYQFDAQRIYGLVVVTDGGDYLRLGHMATILDLLIDSHLMEPVVAAFVDPKTDLQKPESNHRMTEYAADDNYLEFLAKEVLPLASSQAKINPDPKTHVILGASMGGLISTYAVLRRPDLFLSAFSQSPAYKQGKGKVLDMVKNGVTTAGTFYIQTGTIHDTQVEARTVEEGLKKSGAKVYYEESHEGHNWKNWYTKLHYGLIYFFPYSELR